MYSTCRPQVFDDPLPFVTLCNKYNTDPKKQSNVGVYGFKW